MGNVGKLMSMDVFLWESAIYKALFSTKIDENCVPHHVKSIRIINHLRCFYKSPKEEASVSCSLHALMTVAC